VLIAVSRKSAGFLERLGVTHAVLPDIQENDDAGLPTVEWFRDGARIAGCIDAEIDLLKRFRPDRAVGVFRFTLKASAQAADVPFDSLASGCLLPGGSEVLGYSDGEPGRASQQIILDGFYGYAGEDLARDRRRHRPVQDARSFLVGEHTLLWDFPEFAAAPDIPGVMHVGPITWDHWPYDPVDIDALTEKEAPLAVVAFGTCAAQTAVAERIVNILVRLGYHVLLAAGGQQALLDKIPGNGHVTVCSFAPLHEIFPHASLLVTHGGQMTVFEALKHEVPVMVMPFQPEQAHNGVCLERLGCGSRLIPSQCFQGNPAVYLDALNGRSDAEIAADIAAFTKDPALPGRLVAVKAVMDGYRSVDAVADRLEAA
jgi:UDP:flavonoid glycosyltransferase YjiC (YdhE family)